MLKFIFSRLPYTWQFEIAKQRFKAGRIDFYRETRLDIAKHGMRNKETLVARVNKHLARTKARGESTSLAFSSISNRLRAGDNVAAALRQFIPQDEYTLLDISRLSSKKDAVEHGFALAEVAAISKRILRDAVSLEVSYPLLIMLAVFGCSMLFGGELFPDASEALPVDQWPLAGQILYAIDTFNFKHWVLISTALIGLAFVYFKTLQTWSGVIRTKWDAIPFLYRNNRDLRAAQLIVSFAALFESGLTFRQAIRRLLRTSDPWLSWHLREMDRRLTAEPHRPMAAFDTGLFSTLIVDKVSDAAGRDQFEEAITELGTQSLKEIVEAVQRNAKRVSYFLLGFAGLFFILIAIGSYLAIGFVTITGYSAIS